MSKEKDVISALKAGASFMRGLLFERIKIRMVPYLTFISDHSFENGYRIENLIKEIKTKETSRE